MTLNLSCPDWEQRLRSGRPLVPDLHLPSPNEGDRAVAIFNRLRLFDVAGTPTMAEAGGEWFRRIVWALFASVDPETKRRLIQEVFVLVAKKNNKTTGGALLMLTALLMNQRPRAPFLLLGPVQKTATDAFAAVEGAIALDPVLEKKLHVRDHIKTIVHRETKATLEVMTFDPNIVTGKKNCGALVDELHVLGKNSRASKAMVQLRGGMMPFPEAFLAIITTQSDEAPAGVFKDDLTKAREIRDGKREGSMLPVLYEFPREMQQDPDKPWKDPANWPLVNPNLGLSVSIEKLQALCADEEAKGEAELRVWASQHLNIEIGLALHSNRWAGADFWERAQRPRFTLDELLARCEVVDVGIDGGGLDDLLGLVVLGREVETHNWLAWAHAWAHRSVFERRKSEAERLKGFAADGDLTIVQELGDDIEDIAEIAKKVKKSGKLDKFGVDAHGIGAILDALMDAGINEDQIAAISQGWKLTGAIKTTERRVAEGALLHGGQPLLTWCVGNAKVELRGNAIIVTKAASGTGKIDALMALFDAVSLLQLNPKPAKKYQVVLI